MTKQVAYVINLERRPDRWAKMQELWTPWFELMRIPAVNLPGNGAGGCKMSHHMVANHYLQQPTLSCKLTPSEPVILVLEDDAVPLPAMEKIGMKCIEDAAKYVNEWAVVNLGPYLDVSCLGLGRANLEPTRSEYFLAASYCQQTHMMMYNRRALPFLTGALDSTLPLDIYIGRMVNDVWVPIHLLATQSNSPSDISKPRVDANALYSLTEQMLSEAVNKAK